MSVKIRLTRTGKKHQPSYRIIVIDSRSPRDGKPIENLGYFDPHLPTNKTKIDSERYEYWLSAGAQPTDAVVKLVEGTYEYTPYNPTPKETVGKNEIEEPTKSPEETPPVQTEDSAKDNGEEKPKGDTAEVDTTSDEEEPAES